VTRANDADSHNGVRINTNLPFILTLFVTTASWQVTRKRLRTKIYDSARLP
jgi:hypothetical protein